MCEFAFLFLGLLLIGPTSAGVLEVPDEYKETVKEAEMELEKRNPDWRQGSAEQILPPEMELTDAEWHSPTLPEDLECDGCQAISHQFHLAFDKVHTVRNMNEGSGKRLPEHEVIDMAEKLCSMETFAVYGLGHDAGEDRNRVKGPGVPGKKGFAMMGDAMPRWLVRMCKDMLETDESTIYSRWLKDGRTHVSLIRLLCLEENDICDRNLNSKKIRKVKRAPESDETTSEDEAEADVSPSDETTCEENYEEGEGECKVEL